MATRVFCGIEVTPLSSWPSAPTSVRYTFYLPACMTLAYLDHPLCLCSSLQYQHPCTQGNCPCSSAQPCLSHAVGLSVKHCCSRLPSHNLACNNLCRLHTCYCMATCLQQRSWPALRRQLLATAQCLLRWKRQSRPCLMMHISWAASWWASMPCRPAIQSRTLP